MSEPQRASPHVVLYSQSGCHLCEAAQQTLQVHGVTPICVDIDGDPDLRERFGESVPVVEIDGKIRFRGTVDPVLLQRLLTHPI